MDDVVTCATVDNIIAGASPNAVGAIPSYYRIIAITGVEDDLVVPNDARNQRVIGNVRKMYCVVAT